LEPARIRITADTGPESDARELQDATRQLRQMLLANRVGRVDLEHSGEAPAGSKAADLVTVGALVVVLGPPMIKGAVDIVNAWANRRAGRSAKMTVGEHTLELTGVTSAQTQAVIDEFLRRTDPERGEAADDGEA